MMDDLNPRPTTDRPATDKLSDHCYDGIQEYDNPTPGWWNMLFVATVVFSPLYLLWFHSPTSGRTLLSQYEVDLAANMKLQFGELGDLEPDEATIVKYMDDPQWIKVGQATFATNCVSCHGRGGEGVSAPNMTDDHYLHVKQVADIAAVIKNGAKNGAMPAWGNRLHPNEVVLAAAYVASMRGKNLPSARPAEGEVIPPWPTATP
jgi:cytochrome c oxidase cbb3-type subunit 3